MPLHLSQVPEDKTTDPATCMTLTRRAKDTSKVTYSPGMHQGDFQGFPFIITDMPGTTSQESVSIAPLHRLPIQHTRVYPRTIPRNRWHSQRLPKTRDPPRTIPQLPIHNMICIERYGLTKDTPGCRYISHGYTRDKSEDPDTSARLCQG